MRRPSSPFSLDPEARPLALQHVEDVRVAFHMPLKEVFKAGHRDGICMDRDGICIITADMGTAKMPSHQVLNRHQHFTMAS